MRVIMNCNSFVSQRSSARIRRRADQSVNLRSIVASSAFALCLGVGAAHASAYDTAVESYDPLAYFNFANATATQTTSAVNGYTLNLENGAAVVAGAGPQINQAATPGLVLSNGASGTEYATSGAGGLMGGVSTSGTILASIDLASLPSTNGRVYSIAGESADGDDLDLQINPDNSIDFYTNGGGSATTAPLTSSQLGQYLSIAATFTSGGLADVYIDGSLAATAGAGNRYDSGSPFYIGQSNVFGGRYFDGSIGDVAIFNTALSSSKIAGLYATSQLPSVPVSGVPEPGVWVMMLGGFAILGAMLRMGHALRRERQVSGIATA
jgi:hypothetical protein